MVGYPREPLRSPLLILTITFGLLLPACGGGGGDGGGSPTEFRITSINPLDQSSGIALTADVVLFFNEPVDEATVSNTSVRVVAETGDTIIGTLTVPIVSNRQVRFRPSFGYIPFALHRVEVTRDVRDTTGRVLDRTYTFEFQAREEGPGLPVQAQLTDLGDGLQTGRWLHRMTRIGGNRFLVAGGYSGTGTTTDTAENLIVAQQQSFALTNKLNQARAAHVQVLLNDGRVLIAGGEAADNPFTPLDSAEIFDPADQSFTVVAPMASARSFARAVLLPNGNVLVTGGQDLDANDNLVFRDDVEIYDPVANTWTTLGSTMAAGRSGHFVAIAPDGNAVVLGGVNGTASGEVLNLLTNQFGPAATPPSTAHFLTAGATLADGRPIAFGGFESLGVTIYDVTFGFVGALNEMQDERAFHTATRFPDGRVLVLGGFHFSAGLIRNTAEMFIEIGGTGKMFSVPNFQLPNPTSHHAAALDADGRVWATGGLPTNAQLPGLRQVFFVRPEE